MGLSAKIEAVVLPIISRYGCNLVLGSFHREKNGYVLRLLVERIDATPEKGSGVDVGLCASISRDIGTALEVEETIEKKYVLEVSSPGIERPLVHIKDYTKYQGRTAVLKTKRAIEGQRRFKGTLEAAGDGIVTVRMRGGQTVAIPHDFIAKANLVFEPKGFETNAGD
jgi:ribosome maturation factor RimP